jgi:His Kinase A (phospho-acceptor) domain
MRLEHAEGGLALAKESKKRTQIRKIQSTHESERLKLVFLDAITHDFKSPLTSIKASVTGLLEDLETDREQRKELLTIIDEECDRINHLCGEAQCVLGIGWCARSRALNCAASRNKLQRRDFNGIKCGTDHHEFAVRPQTVDQLGHRFRIWGRRQNDLRATQFLQLFGCVRRFAVNVQARAEFLCECRVFGPAPDSRNLVTKLVRKLNSEVAQTANALHGNNVAWHGAAVPQRIEGGNSGAKKRSRFHVTQCVGNRGQRFHRSHHVMLVSAVITDARNFQIAAIAKIPAPT